MPFIISTGLYGNQYSHFADQLLSKMAKCQKNIVDKELKDWNL